MLSLCKQRWFTLWRHTNARGNPRADWDMLVSKYSEEHRAHHTLEHIHQCLNELETLWLDASNPYLIAWALWFHGYFYDIRRDAHNPHNEERSAVQSIRTAYRASIDGQFAVTASFLILGTKDHTADPAQFSPAYPSDLNILRGINLSILGKPWPRYDLYRRQIRQEYRHVPWDVYTLERSKILWNMATQKKLFLHEPLYERYEQRAKENMRRELRLLQHSEERNAQPEL